MTLRELIPGLRVQVSFPPAGVIGKHWIDAIVFEKRGLCAHLALVGHPAWRKHYIGLVINKRDLDAGLVRPQPSGSINRCTQCGLPVHASESNDDSICVPCMRVLGLAPELP